MKPSILTIALLLFLIQGKAQNCTIDFSYSIGPNNVVSIVGESTVCGSPTGSIFGMNFDDPISGGLNTRPMWGNHFYENAGTYSICMLQGWNSWCGDCIDSVCYEIIIPNDAISLCESEYCYYSDTTGGNLSVTFYNVSNVDDSVTHVYWDFNDGLEDVINIDETSHTIPYFSTPWLTYLYIRTASGCQSVFVDTIIPGFNSCLASGIETSPLIASSFLELFPNPIKSVASIQTNIDIVGCELKVFNLLGEEVDRFSIIESNQQLDFSHLKNGIYLYRIQSNNNSVNSGRLVKI